MSRGSVPGPGLRRFCAVGESAGGHLALWLAQPWGEAGPAVDCAVAIAGPTDLNTLPEATRAYAVELVGRPTLLSRYDESVALLAASPVTAASRTSAPILLVQGTLDPVVPLDQAQELAAVYAALGVRARILPFVGGHGFYSLPRPQFTWLWDRIADFVIGGTRAER
jgi:dipeptidyl aminopeptidase/acylaminoacyl peptidase